MLLRRYDPLLLLQVDVLRMHLRVLMERLGLRGEWGSRRGVGQVRGGDVRWDGTLQRRLRLLLVGV
jgi:hypothetical protein